jgi:hypothetical protein
MTFQVCKSQLSQQVSMFLFVFYNKIVHYEEFSSTAPLTNWFVLRLYFPLWSWNYLFGNYFYVEIKFIGQLNKTTKVGPMMMARLHRHVKAALTRKMLYAQVTHCREILYILWETCKNYNPSGTFPPLDVHGTSVHPSHIYIQIENFWWRQDSHRMSSNDSLKMSFFCPCYLQETSVRSSFLL